MDKNDFKSVFATLIIIIIAILLAIAGSDGGLTIFNGIPLFALGIAIAFVIQWIAFIPAYIKKTEKFYDLIGSITYSTIVILSIILTLGPDINIRSIVLMILVLIWTGRLGIFLFRRILKAGEDKRFKQIKQSATRFLLTWTIQGLWVSFTLAAALAVITTESVKFGLFGIIGLGVWIIGFTIEAMADYQKNKFRGNPDNEGKFINIGLWKKSRHPNYFGEIVLWIGIAIIALPTLEGLRWLTLISPIFVIFLLTKVSGVPLLEDYADKKWGGQDDYEQYKNETPVLIPKFF